MAEKWSQLMAALFECSRSPSAELRESALRIFTAVPDLISDQHNDALKGVFSASLSDPESQNVSIMQRTKEIQFDVILM